MVGRQGFGLLRRRPLRRFAPCALRWQTLTRFLSSAPFRVRTRAPVTKKRPTGVDRFLFYGGPSGVRPAPQAAAAALRALRAALANAHAFPQLRALSGSNPCTGNKKATNRSRSPLSFMVGRQGFGLLRRRPLRRFAPCALRWQTLTRFLSSAPFRVRTRAPVTKKRPTGVDRLCLLWWAVRGSNPGPWD